MGRKEGQSENLSIPAGGGITRHDRGSAYLSRSVGIAPAASYLHDRMFDCSLFPVHQAELLNTSKRKTSLALLRNCHLLD